MVLIAGFPIVYGDSHTPCIKYSTTNYLRSQEIIAWNVSGWVYWNGNLIPHRWTEVWIQNGTVYLERFNVTVPRYYKVWLESTYAVDLGKPFLINGNNYIKAPMSKTNKDNTEVYYTEKEKKKLRKELLESGVVYNYTKLDITAFINETLESYVGVKGKNT